MKNIESRSPDSWFTAAEKNLTNSPQGEHSVSQHTRVREW